MTEHGNQGVIANVIVCKKKTIEEQRTGESGGGCQRGMVVVVLLLMVLENLKGLVCCNGGRNLDYSGGGTIACSQR